MDEESSALLSTQWSSACAPHVSTTRSRSTSCCIRRAGSGICWISQSGSIGSVLSHTELINQKVGCHEQIFPINLRKDIDQKVVEMPNDQTMNQIEVRIAHHYRFFVYKEMNEQRMR